MTQFRPCIDLHNGLVKQIVGGTLRDDGSQPAENHVSQHDAAWFASKYRNDQLNGGHVIKLGPGNEDAARSALAAWPGGLQIGGGINDQNAAEWLEAGASHVIVTSWLFDESGQLLPERLDALSQSIGRDKLVLDLSCRRDGDSWYVAMNRWQTRTNVNIDLDTLDRLASYASEFLIHAADVEGLCRGVDLELVKLLGKWNGVPVTYAGGAASMSDLEQVAEVSRGNVDITVGSALDIFGGAGIKYSDLLDWNSSRE
ncbi:phosphoribosylformimino-5-aminoimidazole carboxamide ribotide isomerase [Mariniblastus sp.]|nr:phosphoribosylformimino-5-aminoimidazole carboxamide ribotide isomerase [Mariniblastus sp.]